MPFTVKEIKKVSADYDFILGTFFKSFREDDEISLNYVSDSIKISKAHLSNFEHGKKRLSDDKLKTLKKFYGIEFNEDKEKLTEIRELLLKIYQTYVELDEETEFNLLENAIKRKDEFVYSYGCFTFKLIELMHMIRIERKEELTQNKIDEVLNLMDVYNNEEKCILYDLITINNIYNNDYMQAKINILKALDFSKLSDIHFLNLVVLYHSIIIFQRVNNPVKALLYCEEAIQKGEREKLYMRLFYLYMHKGNCFSRLYLFDEAKNCYLEILDKTKFLKDNFFIIAIYENLCWNSLKAKNYKETIEYANLAIKNGSNGEDLLYYIVYALFHLDEYNECLKLIESNSKKIDNHSFSYLIQLSIKYKINKDNDKFLKTINECYELSKTERDYESQILVLNMMLDYFKELNAFEKIANIQEQLLSLYVRN